MIRATTPFEVDGGVMELKDLFVEKEYKSYGRPKLDNVFYTQFDHFSLSEIFSLDLKYEWQIR